ncbi:MSMEG_0570 family protein [Actinokineospora iranica]|uniref:MSMEG_0570 family protein n=2 Tax=Actinokineospora iranica TaxID=1271860 RepID=A0A1G6MU61_9PSEU|nr:MSMEG_0570 family protein [Actinokineospora iranica]
MPEMYFAVRWPDGSSQQCYSPSSVVAEYLEPGTRYPVGEFVERGCAALAVGSGRVREKHGFECGSALA